MLERQGISEKYMEIIIKHLVKHKLIHGLRGKGGGYRLIRSAADYSVGMQFAKAVADRIVFIDEGKIMEEGTAKEFFEHPQTERAKKFLHVFSFIRSAADYSVGEILEAVGEQLAPVSCLLPETDNCQAGRNRGWRLCVP